MDTTTMTTMTTMATEDRVSGEFVDFAGERYYLIRNVDNMKPFFISVVSNVDHWLFASSTGGLTAGRISPQTALFPYITVDRIHESAAHTGSKTIIRTSVNGATKLWEPFNREHDNRYTVSRNLYKNVFGNKLCFEEINHDLQMVFRYSWATSDSFGFVRQSELCNLGNRDVTVEVLDGLQNILPAGTPLFAQTNTSNLVDAYKWTELDESTGLACLTLYSGISDRAEPSESLKATTVFSLGLSGHKTLISSAQLRQFNLGQELEQEHNTRGIRGAYFINQRFNLAPQTPQTWRVITNTEQTQSAVVKLTRELQNPAELDREVTQSIREGTDELAHIMAGGDAYQATAEENVSVHHYANVLFNILRGGVFYYHYRAPTADFCATVRHFNHDVYQKHETFFASLPEYQNFDELLSGITQLQDPQLERLTRDYLPITFGRRHGDPSRPWNMFAINVKDEDGKELLSYQGNWRDIFQNWEALLYSYPGFIENVIAKFVNASTIDGYNPYRITKEGIDWEVEEEDNPWSFIGYWGDHQIIYLLKLLELSRDFHPGSLQALLHRKVFSYANVPYRIAPFEAQLENPKNTVSFDEALEQLIEERVAKNGADGKLLLQANGEVYLVNLLEKLLVPLLSKLGNLIVDGGIWLTTQRPEWNDANNALVGHGLSMVTLYYMRRYVRFLQDLLTDDAATYDISTEVHQWLVETASALADMQPLLGGAMISPSDRFHTQTELGQAASRYRQKVYQQEIFSGTVECHNRDITTLLDHALAAIDHSIGTNRREDGLYHAYNLIGLEQNTISVDTLYPMLEGQVAVLSAGAIKPEEAVHVLDALFASDVYRADQHSFMLYPDRKLPGFLAKNRISPEQIAGIKLLEIMLAADDHRIVVRDADNCLRFNADFKNAGDLKAELDALAADYGVKVENSRNAIRDLYEDVFQHKAFTGRSGTMFGFEGLGSIYWHMVSKLLLAVMENFFSAIDQQADAAICQRIGEHYYQIRHGIGFNKTPAEYGAFPTDPYSHTPKQSGARQPGMTGQVKEEIVSRFGELGLRVHNGSVRFQPALLREQEFVTQPRDFHYADLNGDWHTVNVPSNSLAFTWCQVPVIYILDDKAAPGVQIIRVNGESEELSQLAIGPDISSELFERSGRIRELRVTFNRQKLFAA